MNGCGRSEALPCDRVLWLAAARAASQPPKISWHHHQLSLPCPSSRPRPSQARSPIEDLVWFGGPGTISSVWCLWTFISWCQAGTTEALWPWMSGPARHEPAVPFRQPTPTRAHDTPQCLCVVWATLPRTPPARRLLSGWPMVRGKEFFGLGGATTVSMRWAFAAWPGPNSGRRRNNQCCFTKNGGDLFSANLKSIRFSKIYIL